MHQQSDTTSGKPFTDVVRELNVTRWMSVGAMFLSAISVIAIAITGWRATDTALAQAVEINAQQRAFNRDLVFAIGDLAEKTGILTSADYCPVRFRMRMEDASVPARNVFGALERCLSDGGIQDCGEFTTVSGVLDFGLQPPGRYRLKLETAEGMLLTHEFDVLPGVPVDRVVICPKMAAPEELPTDVEVAVNWPVQSAAEDLLALIEIEPGPFVAGEWRWEQSLRWSVKVLATSHAGVEPSPAMIQQLKTDDAFADDLHLKVFPSNGVQVPYRYCRIRAITFIHHFRGDPSGEQWRSLGTVIFGTKEQRQETDTGNCWEAGDPAPLYEARPGSRNYWTVDVPAACVDRIVRRIQDLRDAFSNPT